MALISFATPTPAQEVSVPDPNLDAAIREVLGKPAGPLTQQDMLGLTNFGAVFRNITNVQGLEAARNLVSLDLQDNRITNVNILTNLTRLVLLDLGENRFPEFTLPPGLTNLAKLRLESGVLTNLSLPAGLTQLTNLSVGFNQLTSLTLPADMTNLILLSAFQNQLTKLTLPSKLTDLNWLDLSDNQLRSLNLPAGLTNLSFIALDGNQLTSFTVPVDMTNLSALRINDNQLTNLTLSAGLNHLSLLVASGNQLPSLTLSPGLTSLAFLELNGNQLTNLTLPPDMQQLTGLFIADNPLTTFVLSESLAATGMASVVDAFQNQGIPVFTYPLAVQLVRPLMLVGSFKFGITGPPGDYMILGSTNLATWSAVGVATNPLGSVNFHDVTTNASPQKFYRALRQDPPANMAFIPPNTFTMGSPTNDFDSSINERPQTTVTLTRGFWIGEFEVTQGEYLSVMGTNPSEFPGDLNRPVSSVTWFDATNYCGMLTQRELAAGRIPPGSRFRLPTEAEWEYAARAGTTTRFSYGDDAPNYTSLANYAWFLDLGHPDLTVHAVGQKLPNPWGLYDMYGNVWEWCQDWYDSLPGGVQIDPTGPPGPVQFDEKVMRGGAYDYPNSSCRSASRLFRPANQPDSDLGFRVVFDLGL
ncbi:MAG TPA: SUMF1/EgtB/PvdO family nonheme iron enzyme [Candidatus Angelobacter sp.]|nr:SUMF1/EgtB/PvdO family nonheme iron enzyme [Candidatus Angelobacter sp.]